MGLPKIDIELLGINLEENLTTKYWLNRFEECGEDDFVAATMNVDCHPEEWDGACLCHECQSSA